MGVDAWGYSDPQIAAATHFALLRVELILTSGSQSEVKTYMYLRLSVGEASSQFSSGTDETRRDDVLELIADRGTLEMTMDPTQVQS